MSDKKVPPPPVLPPSIKIKENFCLFHKGGIADDIYTCPTCKTEYCLECAKKVKLEGKSCIKCKQIIIL